MADSHETRRRPRRGLARWVAVALVIHAEFLIVILLAAFFWSPRNADLLLSAGRESEAIDISTLDDETSRKILEEIQKDEEQAQEEERKKEQERPEAPGQVVELPPSIDERHPDKARFAAEHDSSVQKETKKYGKFDEKARRAEVPGSAEQTRPAVPATPPAPRSSPRPPGAIAMRTRGPRGRPGAPGMPGEQQPQMPGKPGDPLEAPSEENGELSPPGQGAELRPPGGAAGGGVPSPNTGAPPALLPSEQQVARAVGSGTQDYLKNIDDGDETALNAKKWKFASFFNRVKQQVRDHWRPAEEYRRRDPTGSIYGQKDRYTLLRVQLKPDGSLANVALESPSGIEFLDDEAIEAFKQAQPFPNPPKQLVDGDSGLINFRFGFFFELNGTSPRFKVFRYNSM
jgi:TonB family protein